MNSLYAQHWVLCEGVGKSKQEMTQELVIQAANTYGDMFWAIPV